MSKVAVVYWSGSGNTEMMAGAVLAAESVMCNNTPDDEGLLNCETLGEALA